MGQTAFPLDPEEPDLVLEPVIGWRMWKLRRLPGGGLLIESPVRPLPWMPREPARARCVATTGRGRPPHERCTCGLYAASSPERLRAAGVPLAGPRCSVTGTVAMWCRVIEHHFGYRGELGYPDRIRLVCAPCLLVAGSALPTRVFAGPTGELMALCASHAPDRTALEIAPAELQAELLSTYAVDLLPFEALAGVAHPEPVVPPPVVTSPPPRPPRTLAAEVRHEACALFGSGMGQLAIGVLVLAFFVLRGVGVLTSPPIPHPTPTRVASAGPDVSPPPRTGDPVRNEPPPPVEEPAQPFRLELVCGRLEGVVVTRTRCGPEVPALLGAATHPPDPRAECEMDGYTRKGRYSVCWFDLSGDGVPSPSRPETWRFPRVPFEDLFRTPDDLIRRDGLQAADRLRARRHRST